MRSPTSRRRRGRRPRFAGTVVAGPRRVVTIGAGAPLRVIGERINPTGKQALAESLRAGSMSVVRAYAAEQEAAGADLLDVNVGAAGVDAVDGRCRRRCWRLSGRATLPLVLDTTDPAALEAALRVYPGRALVNTVNGDPESMDAVLPLAARYGAARRRARARRRRHPRRRRGPPRDRRARPGQARATGGFPTSDLVVDALVMTAATDAEAPRDHARGTARLRTASGLATVLGVCNVSHGLPDRPLLNAAFSRAAAAARARRGDRQPERPRGDGGGATREPGTGGRCGSPTRMPRRGRRGTLRTTRRIARAAAGVGGAVRAAAGADDVREPSTRSAALETAVLRGDADAAPALVDAVIAAGTAPEDVIGEVLTPAIQRLGDAYGRGEVFLPQMMVAAEAMKAAVARVKTHLPEGARAVGGPRGVRDREGRHPLDRQGHLRLAAREPGLRGRRPGRGRAARARCSRRRRGPMPCASRRS